MVLVGFDRASMAKHAGILTREALGHAGVISLSPFSPAHGLRQAGNTVGESLARRQKLGLGRPDSVPAPRIQPQRLIEEERSACVLEIVGAWDLAVIQIPGTTSVGSRLATMRRPGRRNNSDSTNGMLMRRGAAGSVPENLRSIALGCRNNGACGAAASAASSPPT